MWKLFYILVVTVVLASAFESTTKLSTENASNLELSEPRIFILAKMTKEVLKLKLYALKTAVEVASDINQYKKEIKAIVKVSLENINDQMNDLENIVKNATREAKKDKISISSCIRKERLDKWKKVRSGRVRQCKKTFTFNILKVKLTKLAAVKVKAVSIIPECTLLHPLSNKKLKNCIEDKLVATYSEANSIRSEIDAEAANIYDDANNCIEDNLGNLDLDIEQISDDFTKCVKDKLYQE